MGENDAMTLKEINRMKSNCMQKAVYVHSSWYTVSIPVHQMNHRIQAKFMPEATETNIAIMRYTKSLTSSLTVKTPSTRFDQ